MDTKVLGVGCGVEHAEEIEYLSSGCPGHHGGGGMLDLHLVQENVAVFGDLDVSRPGDQHLHGALGAQVGLQYVLEAFGGADVE